MSLKKYRRLPKFNFILYQNDFVITKNYYAEQWMFISDIISHSAINHVG